MKRLRNFMGDVRGAAAVEYGLIISLVVLAMIGGLVSFADASIGMWNNVSEDVTTAGT